MQELEGGCRGAEEVGLLTWVARAVSREEASLNTPVARLFALLAAAAWVGTKISAETTTEPAVKVRLTALVETLASVAINERIDSLAAPP